LVLSGSGHGAIDGKVIKKRSDFFFAHLRGMTFPVKQNVPANPIQIGLLGADRIAFDSQVPADAVEQFWSSWDRICYGEHRGESENGEGRR